MDRYELADYMEELIAFRILQIHVSVEQLS